MLEKVFEKTLNEIFLNFWANIIGSFIGGFIGLIEKGFLGAIIGFFIGLIISIIIQAIIIIHYFGASIRGILKSLADQSISFKQLFRERYENYGKTMVDTLDSLRKESGISKEKLSLTDQLDLIKNCFEIYKNPLEAWHVWNFNILALDSIDQSEVKIFLDRAGELYYQKNVNQKNRFIIVDNADIIGIKLEEYKKLTIGFQQKWYDLHDPWHKLFEYHKQKSIELSYILKNIFDTSIRRELLMFNDFVCIKYKKICWILGIRDLNTLIFREFKINKTSQKFLDNLELLKKYAVEVKISA